MGRILVTAALLAALAAPSWAQGVYRESVCCRGQNGSFASAAAEPAAQMEMEEAASGHSGHSQHAAASHTQRAAEAASPKQASGHASHASHAGHAPANSGQQPDSRANSDSRCGASGAQDNASCGFPEAAVPNQSSPAPGSPERSGGAPCGEPSCGFGLPTLTAVLSPSPLGEMEPPSRSPDPFDEALPLNPFTPPPCHPPRA
jgi:hypothetical protein